MLRYDRQTKPGLVASTSGQETERVYSYNPGAHMGLIHFVYKQ